MAAKKKKVFVITQETAGKVSCSLDWERPSGETTKESLLDEDNTYKVEEVEVHESVVSMLEYMIPFLETIPCPVEVKASSSEERILAMTMDGACTDPAEMIISVIPSIVLAAHSKA